MNQSDPFIAARTARIKLRDGTSVLIRPIVPEDAPRLAQGMQELSPHSRYLRFLRPVDRLSSAELRYLTNVDFVNHFAWVAFTTPDLHGIGVARYALVEPGVAEAAVVVLDRFQHRGLGGTLLRLLAETALENDIGSFRAWVTPQNAVVLRTLDEWGLERRLDEGIVIVDVPLPLPPSELLESSLYRTLRAAARGELDVQPEHQRPSGNSTE